MMRSRQTAEEQGWVAHRIDPHAPVAQVVARVIRAHQAELARETLAERVEVGAGAAGAEPGETIEGEPVTVSVTKA